MAAGIRRKRRGGLRQSLFVFFACGVAIDSAQLLFRACRLRPSRARESGPSYFFTVHRLDGIEGKLNFEPGGVLRQPNLCHWCSHTEGEGTNFHSLSSPAKVIIIMIFSGSQVKNKIIY